LKILILTYYWPPSGGSGVQRWLYFAMYLKELGIEPVVVTVDSSMASYKFLDHALLEKVKNIRTYRTATLEPFGIYSKLIRKGGIREAIPQGFAGESKPGIMERISRFIRGNFFIPDARVGWNVYARKKAAELLAKEEFSLMITTGPPHSTHLAGSWLKSKFGIRWLADFRDPWLEVYYNKQLFRSSIAQSIDRQYEKRVLGKADFILTVGPGMASLLRQKLSVDQADKVGFIYNGFDEDQFKSRSSSRDSSFFTICHIGLLSENQPIDAFVKALMDLEQNGRLPISRTLKMQFVGKVSPSVLELMRSNCPFIQLETIEYVSHDRAIQYMFDADMLFNSLAVSDQSSLMISGKLMEYVASDKPVLCLGDENGDAARLLNESGHGCVFNRDNIDGIENFLVGVFSGRFKSASTDISRYSRRATGRELELLIRKIVES